MREIPGRTVPVNGRHVYVEESGQGQDWVVFEAGGGCGRTCWDPVPPLLTDQARLVAYDRAGRALSGRTTRQLSIDDLAADLVEMTQAVVPGEFVLVAHSMGGLVARRAAEHLGSRLRGLLLVDPTPETSPVYDTWDQTTKKIDRMLAVTQALSRFRPLARLFSGNVRRLFSAGTYQTMLTEDFTPAGVSQTRREMHMVAAAIPQLRARPPQLPKCPTIVLSAARAAKGRERQNAAIREHQRRYAQSLPDGCHEEVASGHLIQAEQPHLVADRICQLLSRDR
ncbi:alpha/beta fold hydrolase [Nonomuraea guangzhouensis]|uniref:Alpha/beta fold hydrolase n=1 Tax=Nonomuraea guangzhouensis TaxID=1291555 RepID=A0ABW4GBB9_9ACTN|nr:alpha/beta hydrolase [Nonomuraea guangzhouensis]